MKRMHSSSRRPGFAKLASVWLLFWLGLGGVFLYKAAPKAEPATDDRAQVLACSTPTARPQPQPHTKRIEDVQAGDRVWAYDPQTGKWEAKPVIKPLTHEYAGDLVTVTVAGHSVQATGNHPFWVEAGKDLEQRPYSQDVPPADQSGPTRGRWVDARHLEAGDVGLRSGGLAAIEMVTVQQTRQTVYNLKVADLHTYAVGDMGIAVHNKPCFPPGTLVLMGDGSTKAIEKIELGDMVLARDPEAGRPAQPAEVSGLIRDFADGLVRITFRAPNGSTATVTSTRFHPVWTLNKGWVEANRLGRGDVLEGSKATPLPVMGTVVQAHFGPSYNLTVATIHTYYVASNGFSVLVHNANPPPDTQIQAMTDALRADPNNVGLVVHQPDINVTVGRPAYNPDPAGPTWSAAHEDVAIEGGLDPTRSFGGVLGCDKGTFSFEGMSVLNSPGQQTPARMPPALEADLRQGILSRIPPKS